MMLACVDERMSRAWGTHGTAGFFAGLSQTHTMSIGRAILARTHEIGWFMHGAGCTHLWWTSATVLHGQSRGRVSGTTPASLAFRPNTGRLGWQPARRQLHSVPGAERGVARAPPHPLLCNHPSARGHMPADTHSHMQSQMDTYRHTVTHTVCTHTSTNMHKCTHAHACTHTRTRTHAICICICKHASAPCSVQS